MTSENAVAAMTLAENSPQFLCSYWGLCYFPMCEGKHRVCMAMRSGVENIEACVYELTQDEYSLLGEIGDYGRYEFKYSYRKNKPDKKTGEIALLWIESKQPTIFSFRPTAIIAKNPAQGLGQWITVLPGIRYAVNVFVCASGTLRTGKQIFVTVQVVVEPSHAQARVWLMSLNADKTRTGEKLSLADVTTVFRRGLWRSRHSLSAWLCV